MTMRRLLRAATYATSYVILGSPSGDEESLSLLRVKPFWAKPRPFAIAHIVPTLAPNASTVCPSGG